MSTTEQIADRENVYWLAYWRYRHHGYSSETANRLALIAINYKGVQMRRSDNYHDAKTKRLLDGYDYENQAWVQNGKYIRCGHADSMHCNCYGRIHEGENTKKGEK